jgi:hypothetical protein
MKKFTIEVSRASPAQLTTIGLELKIMANGWEKHGPRIFINKQAVLPPALRLAPTEAINKRARKRHKLAMFI